MKFKEERKPPIIFLSYAIEDEKEVFNLHQRLQNAGITPWMAKKDLLVGKNFQVEIQRIIDKSDFVLACLSKCSVQKEGYVQKELRLTLATLAQKPLGKIYLIPVRLDDCEVPDLQIPELAQRLKDINWVNLFEPDGFERILKAVETESGWIRQRKKKIEKNGGRSRGLSPQQETEIMISAPNNFVIQQPEPFTLVTSIYIFLSRAINWVVRTIPQEEGYNDVDDLCSEVLCLYSIMDSGLQGFVYPIDSTLEVSDAKIQRLHQLLVGFGPELPTQDKSEWLNGIIKGYFGDRLGKLISGYLKVVSYASEEGKSAPPDMKKKHTKSFTFCEPYFCDHRFMCLYIFKELVPIFRPDIISAPNTMLGNIFGVNTEQIRSIVDKNFKVVREKAGWPYLAGNMNRGQDIDAYITASLVSFLSKWEGLQSVIRLENEFWNDHEKVDHCVWAIIDLQRRKGKKEAKKDEALTISAQKETEDRTGEKTEIWGGWTECYLGQGRYVFRIRTAARIVTYLCQLGFKPGKIERQTKIGSEEIERMISETTEYVHRAFRDGKRSYCVDLSCFKDAGKALLSDIAGTIATMEMDIYLGKNCKEGDMLRQLTWLLAQQRPDGALPILSKQLLHKHKGSDRILGGLEKPDGHERLNKSLTNTVDAIRMLALFLKNYVSLPIEG